MRKVPGYMARMYGSGRRKFTARLADYLIQTSQPTNKLGAYLLAELDFAAIEQRVQSWDCARDFAQVEATMDFAAAAGATLAAVNADPRNHFGKHALRRFDK